MKKIVLFVFLIVVCDLNAQDSTAHLQEIIVTANRYQQKPGSTGKVISTILRDELDRHAGKSIAEILQIQTGMFVSGANSAPGANKELYFRGANNGNVLILIDGVPVSDPSLINNSFDLNHLSTELIDRIEILKGAQSTLWGSDAVAGVINIITNQTAVHKISPTFLLAGGTYNSFKGNAGIQGRLNRLSYLTSYTFNYSKGFSAAQDSLNQNDYDRDGYHQNNLQIHLGYQWNNYVSFRGQVHLSDYRADIDAGPYTDDRDYSTKNKNRMVHLQWAYKRSKVQLYANHSIITADRLFIDDSSHIGGFSIYSEGKYSGRSMVSELYGVMTWSKRITWVSGIQSLNQLTNQSYQSISSFGPYTTALGDTARAGNFSYYNSITISDQKRYSLDLGFRWNRHSIYGRNSTFSFNPSYHLTKTSRLAFNLSSAYKIPSLYQLYSEYGNRLLKPERSLNLELSLQLETSDQKQKSRFTVFKRTIKDLIIFYVDPGTFASKYINRDEQYDRGLEWEQTSVLNTRLSLQSSLAFIDGKGIEAGTEANNLYRRPKLILNSALYWKPGTRWNISPAIRYISKRLKGPFDPGPAYLSEYVTLDCAINYKITSRWSTFIELMNITNQVYFDVPGYNNRKLNGMVGVRYGG